MKVQLITKQFTIWDESDYIKHTKGIHKSPVTGRSLKKLSDKQGWNRITNRQTP
jgi:hypothetical protein